MKDLSEKLQALDGQGRYRTIMTLPDGKNINATIRCAEDADAPCLWQVATKRTTAFFKTLREATDYCRQKGWL